MTRARNVDLSIIIGEPLLEGLRIQGTAERSKEVLEFGKKAFSGLSRPEMALLHGVILESSPRNG